MARITFRDLATYSLGLLDRLELIDPAAYAETVRVLNLSEPLARMVAAGQVDRVSAEGRDNLVNLRAVAADLLALRCYLDSDTPIPATLVSAVIRVGRDEHGLVDGYGDRFPWALYEGRVVVTGFGEAREASTDYRAG